MMTHPKIITGIVVTIAIVVVGYFVYARNSVNQNDIVVPTTQTNNNDIPLGEMGEQPSGKKMAFADFMKQGGEYKCTIHQYDGETDTVGTTYLDDGMIRGEYNTKVQGLNIDTTFVMRDGYTYTWNSMMPNTGFKSKVTEVNSNNGANASGSYNFNAEEIGDYDCEAWTPDPSKFIIPTNITFKTV